MGKRRGSGEGSVYKRTDGRWAVAVDLGWENGKRKRATAYAPTRAEALKKLKGIQKTVEEAPGTLDEKRSVAQYLEWWITEILMPSNRKDSTKTNYEVVLRKQIVPRLGKCKLSTLTPSDVAKLVTDMRRAGLSPRYQQLAHRVLNLALNDAVRYDRIAKNPASGVRVPRPIRDPAKVHALTDDELRALMQVAQGDSLYAFWVLCAYAGLRKGEALALRWSDFNEEKMELAIERTISRKRGGGLVFTSPKTRNSVRIIALPQLVGDALSKHRLLQQSAAELAGRLWSISGLMFTTEVGKPIDPSSINHRFARLCEEAGLGRERVHNLRHSAARLYREAGALPEDLKDLLGHNLGALSIEMYGSPNARRSHDLAGEMDKLLGGW